MRAQSWVGGGLNAIPLGAAGPFVVQGGRPRRLARASHGRLSAQLHAEVVAADGDDFLVVALHERGVLTKPKEKREKTNRLQIMASHHHPCSVLHQTLSQLSTARKTTQACLFSLFRQNSM